MLLKKIVSGGQSGADLGGLKFAKINKILFGGWMPRGFKTENGPHPEYAEEYGIQESATADYVARTFDNVRDSNATVRFANNFSSPGEAVTLKAINFYKKPHFDVKVDSPPPPQEFASWLIANNVSVLNVAGNRESVSPGIEQFVINYLREVYDSIIQSICIQ